MREAGESARTLAALHAGLRARFRRAGLATPDLEARLLLGATLGLGGAELWADGARLVAEDDVRRVEARAQRRCRGESLARIVGRRGFWTLDLEVSPETLEPRPETERLVEIALGYCTARHGAGAPLAVLDLGAGTGAILLALLSELPATVGIGVEISEAAAATARRNAVRCGLAERALIVCGDFCAPVGGPFDVVVANPPYVRSGDIAGLPPDVRGDPVRALDGGPDGLACYRAILTTARPVLRPAGRMFLELSPELVAPLAGLAAARGWRVVAVDSDLQGAPRVASLELRK